jgi:hypothetical protein
MKNEIVVVNGVQIECPYENEQHFVAIKPICQALGIDHQKQFERIKNDGILSQLYTDTVYNSGADGKKYQMICLPMKYIFGWIFSIDDTKVNDKAKPAFIKYKIECYNALYTKFVSPEVERNTVLLQKAQLKKQYTDLDTKLQNENEDYKKLCEIKAAIMRTGNTIKDIDNKYVGEQLTLFEIV